MKKSRYKLGFLVGILVLVQVIAVSEALPCKWGGTVKIKGNDVNGSLVVPYDSSDYMKISDYENPAGKTTPDFGFYVINVYADNNPYVFFKVNNMSADQMPSLWIDGNVYAPFDLTVTDSDNDGFSVGYPGYTGSDKDCNDNVAACGANCNPGLLVETDCEDGYDNDCDGLTDDADPDCDVCVDKDGDSFNRKNTNPALNCGPVDCDDNNATINPNALEICDGKDNDCDGSIDEGFPDLDGDNLADCVDPDDDNDGINDIDDCIMGFSENITSNFELGFKMGGLTDPAGDFSGEESVEFTSGADSIITFNFDCGSGKIYLNQVKITKNNNSDPEGYLIIKGIDLSSQNKTKIVYLDDMDNTTNTICIRDEEIASISEISSNCGNGFSITCDNVNGTTVTQNGRNYTCTKLDGKYKIDGLVHSGIKEYTYTTIISSGGGGGGGGGGIATLACAESWTCTDWDPEACPPSGRQTRTCTDANNCGTKANKPNEVRTCFYYVAPKEEGFVAETAPVETPPAVAPTATPPAPGILAITGATIGATYQQRPITMSLLTLFILLIIGLFIYSHAKNLKQWPFHLKFEKKRYTALVIIVLIVFIALFIHFVLLTYFGGVA